MVLLKGRQIWLPARDREALTADSGQTAIFENRGSPQPNLAKLRGHSTSNAAGCSSLLY